MCAYVGVLWVKCVFESCKRGQGDLEQFIKFGLTVPQKLSICSLSLTPSIPFSFCFISLFGTNYINLIFLLLNSSHSYLYCQTLRFYRKMWEGIIILKTHKSYIIYFATQQ